MQDFRQGVWGLLDYPGGLMTSFVKWIQAQSSPRSRLYDVRLALTLRHQGVTEFATKNVKDFQGFGLKRVFWWGEAYYRLIKSHSFIHC